MKTFEFSSPAIATRQIHFISSFARAIALHAYKDNDIPSLFCMETI